MRNEILEQPALAAGLLKTGLPLIEAIARAMQLRGIEFVVIAGRGTSDHASVYAQYIFGTRNDLPVALRWDDNQGPSEQYTPTYTLALVRHHCHGVGSGCGEPILDRDSAPGPEPADLVRVGPRPAHPSGRGLSPGGGH